MREKTRKILALGGVMGPILFTVVVMFSAYSRTDYEHVHNFISELGARNTKGNVLMNYVGFMLSGIFFCAFAISLLNITAKNFIYKFGASLILIFGMGMILSGIFSCDPGCPQVGSMESIIHDRVSAVTFFSVILGMLLLGVSFRKSDVFKGISFYTILSGILSAILLFIMINSFETRVFTGLWQRLLLLSIFLWTFLTALLIYNAHDN